MGQGEMDWSESIILAMQGARAVMSNCYPRNVASSFAKTQRQKNDNTLTWVLVRVLCVSSPDARLTRKITPPQFDTWTAHLCRAIDPSDVTTTLRELHVQVDGGFQNSYIFAQRSHPACGRDASAPPSTYHNFPNNYSGVVPHIVPHVVDGGQVVA